MEDRKVVVVGEERLRLASSASYSPTSYMPHSESNGTNITHVQRLGVRTSRES
jgi:hypothetical protein